MKLFKPRIVAAGVAALLAFALAFAPIAMAVLYTDGSVTQGPGYTAPFAPYTNLKAAETHAYYSVVHDVAPYAPYTNLKATETHAYYSVVH